jgi:hypothetical protein
LVQSPEDLCEVLIEALRKYERESLQDFPELAGVLLDVGEVRLNK